MPKDPHAVALGRKGGKVTSDAKTAAVRENGKKGGRPRKPKPDLKQPKQEPNRSGLTYEPVDD